MNASNVHENAISNDSETLSMRAAADLVGVSPSTLHKHRQRLLDAGSTRSGNPPKWAITVEQLERAGWLVRTPNEHSRTFEETPPRTDENAVNWRELFNSERERAERAEVALAEERRRVDGLTSALVMAVRQLEALPSKGSEDVSSDSWIVSETSDVPESVSARPSFFRRLFRQR